MTKYAKRPFSFLNKMVFIAGPHWVVTGDTGNHLAGVGIQDLGAYRMSEIPLGFMTLDADGIATSPEHGQIPASMGFVTTGTFFDWRMLGDCFFVVAQSLTMTGNTDPFLSVFEQGLVVSGMRRVAV